MCGIVGYIGREQAQPILLDGLARLEYRGYDSAGIAVMNEGQIHLCKAKGRLKNLTQRLEEQPLTGSVGIGHTRWATHGEPSDLNAHPHTDQRGDIAIVHNGIIENHEKLRAMLEARGCVFVSQTDTEVVVHLLNMLYEGDMLDAICRAQAMLEGSYALAVLCSREPDRLYCTRRDSPLVVGVSEGAQYIASDIPALLAHTRDVLLLEDREIAVLTAGGAVVYDAFGHPRQANMMHVAWDVASAEKGGYPHFMLKEIHEEPEALRKTFSAHVDVNTMTLRESAFPFTAEEARALTRLTIVACGTAYHAGVIGKYAIEKLARLPVEVDVASEFRYREPIMGEGDLFLAISQSGETADTLAAMREAARLGARTVALTNVLGSSIAREAGDNVLYTYAGPEIAVASTKAYITQVEMMLLLAVDLAVKRGVMSTGDARAILAEMAQIPARAADVLSLEERVKRFCDHHYDRRNVFYIGRGIDYALAMEASLKLKEVSYIFSEAYAAGELKHGTIALIEEGSLVVSLLTQAALVDKTLS
ncbi:MAG: glutamine--fructose-6-phosphate transaminase (isomerizing), partial [Clostridia bacterium]|nr:glutamine--fructose-6-phosphate transaminase (isomerizing) [Clostridia bacterium]